MEPSEILFKKQFGRGGKPLFDSQTDLVREITTAEGSEWKGKNFKSVRAFVNQVVNGERRLSPNLKEAISLVLPERIDPSQDANAIMNDIANAFEAYFNEKKSLKKGNLALSKKIVDANDFYLLEKRGLVADSVLVTSREPVLVNNGKWAREVKYQLLAKLGILEREDTREGRYTYIFPSPDDYNNSAFVFWQRLFNFMKYENDIEDTELLLLEANEKENPPLRVFHASPILCSYPVVIYDLNSLSEVAFTLFGYEDKGVEKISTARISPSFLNWWKEEIYPQLIRPNSEDAVKEVTFRSVLEDIKKNEALF